MQIRVSTGADVEDVVGLVQSAYRGPASRGGWTTEADLLDGQRTDAAALGAIVADPAAQLLLAVDGTEILGCAAVEDRGDRWYFGTFAVRPTDQARGTGSALLAEAERLARGAGAAALELTVIHVREDLIAWYERRGYVRTGETRPFPYGDERFGVPRRDDLSFVVLEKQLTTEVTSS
ncbi:MAG TPA: GNAT family N-acetyltransferase [Mycobacteriales bacterium]